MRVALFKGGDPISFLVRVQTRSEYSHAALLLPGGTTVIEAYPGKGVRVRELTERDVARMDVFEVAGLDDAGQSAALDFAFSMLGEGYDWRGVFRFVTRLPAYVNQRWFCSELVFAAISMAGVNLLERTSAELVSPAMLALSPLLKSPSNS